MAYYLRGKPAKLCHAAAKQWHITAKCFAHLPAGESLGIWTSYNFTAEPPPNPTTVELPHPRYARRPPSVLAIAMPCRTPVTSGYYICQSGGLKWSCGYSI